MKDLEREFEEMVRKLSFVMASLTHSFVNNYTRIVNKD